MKKKMLLLGMTVFLGMAVMGCSSKEPEIVHSIPFEKIDNQVESSQTKEIMAEQEKGTTESTEQPTETAEQEAAGLTFADLSKRQYGFSSGAGGWSEEFTIEKDGYFTGLFHDSNMGDTGEGYPDGTRYSSSYSGHFTDLTQINDHTYQMKLKDISYKETLEGEEIIDNIRYIYTDSYCLGGNDTFTIYLPGTPLSELPEGVVQMWLSSMNQSETELTMIAIVDATNGYGIYSIERLEPLEDAQMTYNSCKESYDYYREKLTQAMTTLEMVEYTGIMYENSDYCLNYIWNLIRYNVAEDKYQEILKEQRQWISEKEARAKESGTQYENGSLAAVDYNDTLARLTMERCEELLEYLKSK